MEENVATVIGVWLPPATWLRFLPLKSIPAAVKDPDFIRMGCGS